MPEESVLTSGLRKLKAKGYIQVGYVVRNEIMADILMIHKDWEVEGFKPLKHIRQALSDLQDVGVTEEFFCTVEAVPLDIYKTKRTGGPKHKILFNTEDLQYGI